MSRRLLLVVALMIMAGCAKEEGFSDKSNVSVSQEETGKAEISNSAVSSESKDAARQEEVSLSQESGAQVAPPAAIVSEMQAKVKETSSAGGIKPSETGDDAIEGHRWGFSVYNPETGVTRYYAGNGSFLGQRPK
jgi:hypothetical protein